jgi:hypothetical protein
MSDPSAMRKAVCDTGYDPDARIKALDGLLQAGSDGDLLEMLETQIEEELASDDPRYVIYLIGAIRRIFDREAIDIFTDLLDRPIDPSFRSQALIGLTELYRNSVKRSMAQHPGHLPARGQIPEQLAPIDENFVIHGKDLTEDDRERIERILLKIAESDEEVPPLRAEARDCYELCQRLGSLIQSEQL